MWHITWISTKAIISYFCLRFDFNLCRSRRPAHEDVLPRGGDRHRGMESDRMRRHRCRSPSPRSSRAAASSPFAARTLTTAASASASSRGNIGNRSPPGATAAASRYRRPSECILLTIYLPHHTYTSD